MLLAFSSSSNTGDSGRALRDGKLHWWNSPAVKGGGEVHRHGHGHGAGSREQKHPQHGGRGFRTGREEASGECCGRGDIGCKPCFSSRAASREIIQALSVGNQVVEWCRDLGDEGQRSCMFVVMPCKFPLSTRCLAEAHAFMRLAGHFTGRRDTSRMPSLPLDGETPTCAVSALRCKDFNDKRIRCGKPVTAVRGR